VAAKRTVRQRIDDVAHSVGRAQVGRALHIESMTARQVTNNAPASSTRNNASTTASRLILAFRSSRRTRTFDRGTERTPAFHKAAAMPVPSAAPSRAMKHDNH
jgi:hypothetical protein